MRWGYSALTGLLGPIVHRLWIEKVEGLDNIPNKGGVIVASNHQSYFDFICFMAISPRPVNYLAAENFFESVHWKFLARLSGAIYVDRRKSRNVSAYKKALSLLTEGKVVGIFPEGTRSSNGKLQRAYTGVARLALTARAPVVPVGMIGTYEILSRHEHWPRLKRCEIKIGEAIRPDSFDQMGPKRSLYRELTDKVMGEIGRLTGQDYPYARHDGGQSSNSGNRLAR